MICTVTFNPALDYVVEVSHSTLGMVNQTVQRGVYYGGKRANVSTVLRNLGCNSTALGFVAGFTGGEIVRGAKTLGFIPDFIRVEYGISRINVKMKPDEENEINGMGPEITPKGVGELFEKLEKLAGGDVPVLSGSILRSIDDDIYENTMAGLGGRGTRIAIDAEKNLLLNVLQYHPFLIKPNNHELGDIFGVVLNGDGKITECVRKLQERDARNVLVSMTDNKAILVNEAGKAHRMGVPKGTVRNSVGTGDSMMAGFVTGYLGRQGYGHALGLGSAAGSTSAFSGGPVSKGGIMKFYQGSSGETRKIHACTDGPGSGQEG